MFRLRDCAVILNVSEGAGRAQTLDSARDLHGVGAVKPHINALTVVRHTSQRGTLANVLNQRLQVLAGHGFCGHLKRRGSCWLSGCIGRYCCIRGSRCS
jgi:hypothetical protein